VRFIVDASQAKILAAQLNGASWAATGKAQAVVKRGAMNVKQQAQALAPSGPHTPAYASSITFDTFAELGGFKAEIGPDKGRAQGALGNIFEYGTGDTPPIPHLGPALEAEADAFEDHMGKIADGIW
jgi:hypothetical protein